MTFVEYCVLGGKPNPTTTPFSLMSHKNNLWNINIIESPCANISIELGHFTDTPRSITNDVVHYMMLQSHRT